MPTAARVVVLPAEPGPLQIQDVLLPDPGPHQVVVRQHATGVCHSQLHQMHRPRTAPVVLGHESTGVVLAAGAEVTHVTEGDEVLVTWVPRTVEPGDRAPAGVRLDLADGSVAATGNVFTWADHTIADERYVVKAPPGTPKDLGSVIGCAVMTGAGAVLHTAPVQPGDSVAVFGVGGVGLSAVAAAAVAGADPVIAVDLSDEKLAMAARFGATELVNGSQGDAVEAVRALTRRPGIRDMGGQEVSGVDFAFDCIGVPSTMAQILAAVRPGAFGYQRGGTAVLVGVPQTTLELDTRDLLIHEKRYIGSIGGSCSPDRDFPTLVQWHRDGRLDLAALVTERFTLDQINEATTALDEGRISGRAILEL
jgi:Zn-dependent alcohol dehydrogenase